MGLLGRDDRRTHRRRDLREIPSGCNRGTVMPFPRTEQEFAEQGYRYMKTEPCKGKTCKAMIAWYLTPKGKWMPLTEGTLEPHWKGCPDAKDFRSINKQNSL